jgi:large subunit ribosomal protein L19e
MNLRKKKILAAKALKVGKKRIVFLEPRLDEIKEAITKQDIKDLQKEGAIMIKEIKGRKKILKKKKKGIGKTKKKVKMRKKVYATLTRKLRKYTGSLKETGKLNPEEVKEIRNRIRNRLFKSKAHLKEYIEKKNKLSTSSSQEIGKTGGLKK